MKIVWTVDQVNSGLGALINKLLLQMRVGKNSDEGLPTLVFRGDIGFALKANLGKISNELLFPLSITDVGTQRNYYRADKSDYTSNAAAVLKDSIRKEIDTRAGASSQVKFNYLLFVLENKQPIPAHLLKHSSGYSKCSEEDKEFLIRFTKYVLQAYPECINTLYEYFNDDVYEKDLDPSTCMRLVELLDNKGAAPVNRYNTAVRYYQALLDKASTHDVHSADFTFKYWSWIHSRVKTVVEEYPFLSTYLEALKTGTLPTLDNLSKITTDVNK